MKDQQRQALREQAVKFYKRPSALAKSYMGMSSDDLPDFIIDLMTDFALSQRDGAGNRCKCRNIEPQSSECYDQMVCMMVPDTVTITANCSDEKKEIICVDPCIAVEVYQLWLKGVHTKGCCCGHGYVEQAQIGVHEDSIELMQSLGYEQHVNPLYPDKKYWFKPKSIQS